jgi:hypothetical protein
MNWKQKLVVAFASVLFVLAGVFPPWLLRGPGGSTFFFTHKHWLFAPPPVAGNGVGVSVCLPVLIVQWITLAVVAVGLLLLLQRRPRAG